MLSLTWRPDGSLITFQRHDSSGIALEMAILSDPLLVREIGRYGEMSGAPVSWRDRMHMVYVANGLIRTRGFGDRVSRPVHFRALVAGPAVAVEPVRPIVRRNIELAHVPDGRLIVRGGRLFDGIWQGYRQDVDVVIESGRIAAVEPRRTRNDGTVIDLGDVVVMPGLVEANGVVHASARDGASLLAYGVTTIATTSVPSSFDASAWDTEESPGPRVIPLSPDEVSADIQSLADAATPGVDSLTSSRQAVALGHTAPPRRRFPEPPVVKLDGRPLVVGGPDNRLPPGMSLHAELRALAAAGLDGQHALHAAGRNPARVIGLENQAGVILPGALGDLLLVRGDPLADVADTLNIIAVVRNGRFFSLVSLLERAESAKNDENVE